jgi:hypothetical protein
MDSATDRRLKPRIVVGPEVTVQFRSRQFAYQNIRITNLSVSGCFATLPRAETHAFRQGTLLEMFQFEHPDLLGDPFVGKIAYVLGGRAGGRGALELVGLGIHFISMAPSMELMLKTFIDQRS